MEDNRTTLLYLHTKKGASEVFYVGIGSSRRPYIIQGRNRWWKRIVNKYDYTVTILADNLTWKQACDMEKYLIKYYGRRDLGTGSLLNMTDGGEGIKSPSEETRAKMSAAKKGKKRSAEAIAASVAGHIGEFHHNVKLAEYQVIEILIELRDNPYRGQNIALGKKYGITRDSISKIKTNRTWTHICRETLKVK